MTCRKLTARLVRARGACAPALLALLAACGTSSSRLDDLLLPLGDTGGAGSGDTGDLDLDSAVDAEAACPEPVPGPITVYAVRHAEKESEGSDPGLTEEGLARAEALAVLLADVPLNAVYATDLLRTQLTVAPTAESHGLPIVISVDPYVELPNHILCVHGGQSVLHAGHSYTLPDFFEELGLNPAPDVDDYGQLWTVYLDGLGGVTVEESHFGEAPPAQ